MDGLIDLQVDFWFVRVCMKKQEKPFLRQKLLIPYIQIIPGNPAIKNDRFIINDTNALVL